MDPIVPHAINDLPLHSPNTDVAPKPHPHPFVTPLQNMKVLVVDDDEILLALMGGIVESCGHTPILAHNGREAVDLYEAVHPHMIIMDVMMPILDGLEATRFIRSMPSSRWCPILFCSGLDDVEHVVRGLHAGGDDFIPKPIEMDIVVAKINGIARALSMQETVSEQAVQLRLWRNEYETQHQLTAHILHRLTRVDGLCDPLVRWHMIPAKTFSGDVICAARSPGGVLHVMVADAVGHGLHSAVTALQVAQPFYAMTTRGYAIESILTELNRRIYDIMPSNYFVSATIASLDIHSQTIKIWNGGNPDAYLLDTAGKPFKTFSSTHPPLGVVAPHAFTSNMASHTYQYDCELLMFTDGLTEAQAPDQRSFGIDGALRAVFGTLPLTRTQAIEGRLHKHLGPHAPHDDVSVLSVRVPIERRIEPRLPDKQCGPRPMSEWRSEVLWGANELRHVDAVPLLLDLVNKVDSLRPHTSAVYLILTELFNNALDHGLLGLDSSLKLGENGFETYLDERANRLSHLMDGQILVSLRLSPMDGETSKLTITVEDSGPGFDYERMLSPETDLLMPYGRGIHIVKSLCESLTYSGRGNHAVAVFQVPNFCTAPQPESF